MSEKSYGFRKSDRVIGADVGRDRNLCLTWFPYYVEDFPEVMNGISLSWKKCRFVKVAKEAVPEEHGVYCFSTLLGKPFPDDIHLVLYIGKAAPGYLSERFIQYFSEKSSDKGREKLIFMLNKYSENLFFWWATLPRIYVDTVEEHLLMCCRPPCNTTAPSHDRLWGKAFARKSDGE